MKKVLLYSIMPEHMLNILNGNKTIEVRKRDLPQWAKDKIDRGEVVEGYGYCTKGKPRLFKLDGIDDYNISNLPPFYGNTLNGKVVFKFEVSGTTKYVDCSDCTNTENGYECENDFMYLLSVDPILRKATCLEADEIEAYGNGADLYAHHFTNIQPIKPMGIGEFMTVSKKLIIDKSYTFAKVYKPYMFADMIDGEAKLIYQLTKAPQSFMTCWVKGELK